MTRTRNGRVRAGDQQVDACVVEAGKPRPDRRRPGRTVLEGACAEAADQRRGEDRSDGASRARLRCRDHWHRNGKRDVEADLVENTAETGLHPGRFASGGRPSLANSPLLLGDRYAGDSCPVSC